MKFGVRIFSFKPTNMPNFSKIGDGWKNRGVRVDMKYPQCVLWYHKLKSPTAVQRKFRNEFGQDPPHTNSIKRWFKKFLQQKLLGEGDHTA